MAAEGRNPAKGARQVAMRGYRIQGNVQTRDVFCSGGINGLACRKVQKKRKRDWNSDDEYDDESDKHFQDLLRIRTAFEAKMDFIEYRPANTQVIKKMGDNDTTWK